MTLIFIIMYWFRHSTTIASFSRCINGRIDHICLMLVHIYHLSFTLNLGISVDSTAIALGIRVFSGGCNLRLSSFFTFLTSIEIVINEIIFNHSYPWICEGWLTLKLPRWFKRDNNKRAKSCRSSINSNVASFRRTSTMITFRYCQIPWLRNLPDYILMLRHP